MLPKTWKTLGKLWDRVWKAGTQGGMRGEFHFCHCLRLI